MAGMLGTIAGQLRIDVAQALVAYSRLRAANAATITALSSVSRTLRGIGTASFIAGAALFALFAKAVKSAADFEKKIDFFGAVTNASKKDMEAVSKLALQMGTTTTFSASQMADAFVEFGKAGISTKDIIDGVAQAVVNLAQAADINLTQASDIIVSTMATFRLHANQTAHIADVLAGAANASIIDITDIGTSLKYVGGIAATTGISLESTATAIALLGNAGIKGSTAGTSLRQMIVSLMGNSKAARKELKALGIITKDGTNLFIDQKGNLKNLSQVFQILQDHTSKLTNAQRLAALKIIFNNRALAAASILTRDGAKGFETMSASISKVKAADVAKKRLDNLAGSTTKLKNTLQTVFIQAGTPFQKMAKEIVDSITRIVQAFGRLSPRTQEMIFRFIEIAGIALMTFGVFSLGASLILRVVIGFMKMRMVFMLVRTAVSSMILTFRILMLMLMGNPIALVVAALVLLAIAFVILYKRSETFRRIVHAVGQALMSVLKAIIGFFKGLLPSVLAAYIIIVTLWNRIYQAVAGVVTKIINGVKAGFNAVKNFFTGSGGSITDSVKAAFSGVTGAISGVFHSAVDAVRGAIKAIGDGISSGISGIINFVKTHWFALLLIFSGPLLPFVLLVRVFWDQISIIFRIAFAAIVGIVRVSWAIVSTIFSVGLIIIVGIVRFTFALIVGIIRVTWIIIQTVFKVAFIIIQAIALVALALLVVAFTATFNFIKGIVVASWNFIVGVFTAAFNFIAPIVAAGWNFITSIISTAWNAIIARVTLAWNIIYAIFLAVGDAVKSQVLYIWNVIAAIYHVAMAKITSFISSGMNRVSSIVRLGTNTAKAVILAGWALIQTYIINPIKRAASAVANTFSAILASITSKLHLAEAVVTASIDKIVAFFNGMKTKIVSAVSGAITLLVSTGEDLIRGMITGVGNMAQALIDKVTAVVSAPVGWAKKKLGIKSPSTVFRDMGINIVQGLNNGLSRGLVGSAAFESRISTFIGNVRKIAAKAYVPLKLPAPPAHATKSQMAAYRKHVADLQAANKASNSNISRDKLTASRLTSNLTKENNILIKETARRTAIHTKLLAANKALAAVQGQFNNVKTKVRDSILGSFDITNQGANTITGLLGNLQDQLTTAKNFAANIKNLAAKGVSKVILGQLAEAGPNAQTDASINALTQATKGQVAQFNSMYAQLGNTANSMGTQIATTLYGAGVRAAQGLVNGLRSQEVALTKQMNRIATQMAATIKKALGIHSPSRVFHNFGINIVQGLINGVERQLPALSRTMQNAALLTAINGRVTPARLAGSSSGNTIINNYEINKTATVHNPPVPATEGQILDSWRKLDALAGGAGVYGG